ncbi:hypothetical protein PCL1606_32560 [Pseudomonas chlororaphis]|uniref:Uncharacterized protein n=1 Tax=Pseudomonas chlororaphis TaxID=587753 RepID=A0A0D5Y144_9PSED|nr:hypothetical protein PCL1606_32560 [Pseudomonas chlororaphis]
MRGVSGKLQAASGKPEQKPEPLLGVLLFSCSLQLEAWSCRP